MAKEKLIPVTDEDGRTTKLTIAQFIRYQQLGKMKPVTIEQIEKWKKSQGIVDY